MPEATKDKTNRWINQAVNDAGRCHENLMRLVQIYSERAPQQCLDCHEMALLVEKLYELLEDFRDNRM